MARVSRSMLMLLALAAAPALASTVEAVPDKEYHLTPNIGPWLIRVATFRGPDALRWANALVYEIRKDQHLDAYIYTAAERRQDLARLTGQTADNQILGRDGRMHHIKYANQPEDEVTVLAGGFKNRDDWGAKRCLSSFKKDFHPRSVPIEAFSFERQIAFEDREVQGISAGAAGNPLATAMLTVNPKAPRDQFVSRLDSDLARRLRKMNSGKFSLYTCPGPMTLQVATFGGASQLINEHDGAARENQAESLMDKWKSEHKSLLREAHLKAEDLTWRLRAEKYDAYVFHGQFASIVTIGSFSQGDPRLEQVNGQVAGKTVGPFQLLAQPIPIVRPTPQ